MISTHIPARFAALGNDGGSYFVKQINRTSEIWWYGEDPRLGWAHVFRGRLIRERNGDRWEGTFIDVPKGLGCGHGNLDWHVEGANSSSPRIVRAPEPGFGGTRIVPQVAGANIPSSGVTRRTPGYLGDGLNNLSGLWIGNDSGSYYIREVSGTNEIAWIGENPEAISPTEDEPGSSWANVMMGQRSGNSIRAHWSDIPKGLIDSEGEIDLMVINENTLRVTRATGRFGGTEFRRVPELELQLRFTSLTVLDQEEWFFEGDEPYFMALIAMMDGTHVNLEGNSVVDVSHSFVAPKLRDNVGAGTVINLSSLPVITIPFLPVIGDSGTHPVLGIALRGAEQDWSDDNWRAGQLEDWTEAARRTLTEALRQTGTVNFRTDSNWLWHVHTWRDEDDIFGYSTRTFTFNQLSSLTGRPPIELNFPLISSNARYDVAATLTVVGARGNCEP